MPRVRANSPRTLSTREHHAETSKIVKAGLLAGSLMPNSPALAERNLFLWMKRPFRCPLSPVGSNGRRNTLIF
jgi:hypothetical protein